MTGNAQSRALGHKRRFPPWLTRRLRPVSSAATVLGTITDLGLMTVCDEAHCPNRAECYGRGTATFLILGPNCSRSCRFCAISSGRPAPPREREPEAVARACRRLRLRHVVVTSVTRDDLPDGGAGHFVGTIRAIRALLPAATIEVLVPDFQGRERDVEATLDATPDVFGHNVETVPRLYREVRPGADYSRSLGVLEHAGRHTRSRGMRARTKTGIMVGLGETHEEVSQVMRDLRNVGCDMLTIGQYLSPSPTHVPVARFVEPREFRSWHEEATALGFKAISAGPFVRSSYQAESLQRSLPPL